MGRQGAQGGFRRRLPQGRARTRASHEIHRRPTKGSIELSARSAKARGALAPLAAFSLALGLMAAPVQGAETPNPAVSNLPAPGTYTLQRIQRIPDAALLDAEDRVTTLSHATRGAITALAFFYGH